MFYRQFMLKMRFKKKKKKFFFGIKQKNGNFKPSIPFLHRKTLILQAYGHKEILYNINSFAI